MAKKPKATEKPAAAAAKKTKAKAGPEATAPTSSLGRITEEMVASGSISQGASFDEDDGHLGFEDTILIATAGCKLTVDLGPCDPEWPSKLHIFMGWQTKTFVAPAEGFTASSFLDAIGEASGDLIDCAYDDFVLDDHGPGFATFTMFGCT
jgi:hypothetical protein